MSHPSVVGLLQTAADPLERVSDPLEFRHAKLVIAARTAIDTLEQSDCVHALAVARFLRMQLER